MSTDLELGDLARIANAILSKVEAGERRRLLRSIARGLQRGQSMRIAAQTEPEGTPFVPRKPKAQKEAGFPMRFLYPKGDPLPRVCLVKRWVHAGPNFIGYDLETNAMRTFAWARVARFIPLRPSDRARPAGPEPRRGRIREAAMFRKLRLARRLRAGATSDEAWAGFAGRDAAIARVHQQGGTDKIGPGGHRVRYARRVLLGLSPTDRARILDQVTGAIAGAI